MKKRNALRVTLGGALGLVGFWVAARGAQWPEVLRALRQVDLVFAGAALLLPLVTFIAYAFRWRLLLAPICKVKAADSFAYVMIGYLGNAVLPMRLGDLVRVGLLSRRYGIEFGLVAATAVVDKASDLLVVLCLGAALGFLLPLPEVLRLGLQVTAVGTLVALLMLVAVSCSRSRLAAAKARLSRYLPERALDYPFSVAETFARGLTVAGSLLRLLAVVGLAVVAWAGGIASLYALMLAFDLNVSWAASALGLVATNLGNAVPSLPGALGVYEGMMVLALSVFPVGASTALVFALTAHALKLALVVVAGTVAAWIEGVRVASLGSQVRDWRRYDALT